MEFRVQNLAVLLSLYMVFERQRLDSICYCLEEILVNFIPVSIYTGLNLLQLSHRLQYFQCLFVSLFVLLVFHAIFQQFVPITGSVFFSICYMFYLQFWGTSFSNQWSVGFGKSALDQCHLQTVPTYFSRPLNM